MDLIPVDHDPYNDPPSNLIPVDHDPWQNVSRDPSTGRPVVTITRPQAEGVVAKPGQTVQAPQGPDVNQAASTVGDMLGMTDAMRAIRGELTPEEAQTFAMGAATMMLGGPEEKAVKAAEEVAVPLASELKQAGIRAYHGSPYDFNQFDLSKIGTGEGAQAYGHGLYFAENPATAEEYKKNVSPQALVPPRRTFQGQELEPGSAPYHAGTLLETMGRTLPGVRKEVQGWIDNAKPGEDVAHYQAVLDTLNQATSKKDFGVLSPKSLMYEVNINADPEHFLDWDKPLIEQPEHIRQKFTDAVLPGNDETDQLLRDLHGADAGHATLGLFPRSSGAQAYNTLASHLEPLESAKTTGAQTATEKLRDAGIPGIKYLDQGSRLSGTVRLQNKYRAAVLDQSPDPADRFLATRFKENSGDLDRTIARLQEDLSAHPNDPQIKKALEVATSPDTKLDWNNAKQTRNYVVFNDKLIDIVKKYGLAGLVAGGAAHFTTQPVDHNPFE
jgi:hypothetical protein